MGKKARSKAMSTAPRPTHSGDIPLVGGREPCPCGSGRRYKACHGRLAAQVAVPAFVPRPFKGLASECDLIAVREFVAAATVGLRLTGEHRDRTVTLATVLPFAVPAIVRETGEVLVSLSPSGGSADPSRRIAGLILAALASEPGTPVPPAEEGADAGRLQELVDPEAPLEITVHDGFDFWITDPAERTGEIAALLEQANVAAYPTRRLSAVQAAYWCAMGDRRFLRWVLPYEENALLTALARLHAAGEGGLGEGTRLLGTFRASGLLVPVWDLPQELTAERLEDPVAEMDKRLAEAVATDAPLTPDERRARDGLRSRQLTIR